MKEYFHHKQGINKTLPKAQRTQGNEYFDSFNTLSTSAWFCLAKGEKYKDQLWRIHVTT